MWRGLSIVAVLLCTAACQQQPALKTPPPAPRIAFDGTTFDFGKVEQGKKVVHDFVFHNTGGANLAIDEVRTSCGCTAAVTSAKVIPPGQSGTIHATFNTSNMFGRKRKTVTVYSSDPAHTVSTLLITGEVTVDIIAQPSDLYLARVRRDQKKSLEVHIVAKDGVAATGVECNSAVVTAEMHELPGSPGGQVISVSLKPDAPLGRFTDRILVKTTSAAHPTLVIPVVGIVEGDVTTSPRQVAFGAVEKDGRDTRLVVVKNAGKNPVRLTGVHLPRRWAEAKVEPVRDGYEYKVVVRLRSGIPLGRLNGTLEIDTENAEQPRLMLPITGLVRSKK